jgi:hypothetical protein
MKPIKEEILHQLEKPINDLTAQIIESEKQAYLKKVGRELNVTPWMEEMIRLSLVIDLMKALQNYILPTDTLVGFNWYGGPKGIEISAGIEREGIRYLFVTEAITAGGYNIQRFHYRYIVKSKMPRVNGGLATEYQNQYKKLTKIEKLEKEIENYQTQITKYQTRIDYLAPMSHEELIVELGKHKMLGWRVKNDYKWEDFDENSYYKQNMSKEQWEAEQRQLIEEGVVDMLNWDVERPKRYIKDFEKKIVKLQTKIDLLK